MANLKELQEKRESLLIEIASVTHDLQEFTKHPCETVDVEQIKYQYGFILREIKKIDDSVKNILLSQMEILNVDFKNLETLLKIEQSKETFSASDLPKNHYSLWENTLL